MILPDLFNLAFSDFVGIFSLPNSKLITRSFETVLDVNGLPTVRLTLGYGRKVLDLSYLPVSAFLLDLARLKLLRIAFVTPPKQYQFVKSLLAARLNTLMPFLDVADCSAGNGQNRSAIVVGIV